MPIRRLLLEDYRAFAQRRQGPDGRVGHRRGKEVPATYASGCDLFDGVDERQSDSALQLGAEYAAVEGFQYIVTLNSDEASKELPDGRELDGFVLPQRLTDHGEDGDLFGRRF